MHSKKKRTKYEEMNAVTIKGLDQILRVFSIEIAGRIFFDCKPA